MPYVVPDYISEPLYAIVPYFNPWRHKSREKHTIRAIKHFQDCGAVVVLVEAAFNRRAFAFADSGLDGAPATCNVIGRDHRFCHRHIQVRTTEELWLKENLINLAVSRLPYDWQNVCWLDSDVHFLRPNWVGETIHKLQHYDFVQMFSHARDLAPNYEMLPETYPHANGHGFVDAWKGGLLDKAALPYDPPYAGKVDTPDRPGFSADGLRVWPGLAWAATRRAWDAVGGLIDFAVWGGGDWHIAHALIDKTDVMMRSDLHPNYKNLVLQWHKRCCDHIRKNVGVVSGSIIHYWHGRKLDRGYNTKHALLAEVGFDPLRHLKRDFQGLWQLNDDGSEDYVKLRDMLRKVAADRNEDADDTRIDLWSQDRWP